MLTRFRPYVIPVGICLYCPVCLLVDSRLQSLNQQYLLGAVTFALLFLVLRRLPVDERRLVWLCVVVATGAELFGSIVWGVYRYRWHNVPLFVPPGHGLVYVAAITGARTPLLLRRGRLFVGIVATIAAGWALAGLTVLPMFTGRFDVLGALLLLPFAWVLHRSPRATMFAAIFVGTSWLELFGVNFGNWLWMPVVPVASIPTGNPPSVVAGGYCGLDGSVVLIGQLLGAIARRMRVAWRSMRPAAETAYLVDE